MKRKILNIFSWTIREFDFLHLTKVSFRYSSNRFFHGIFQEYQTFLKNLSRGPWRNIKKKPEPTCRIYLRDHSECWGEIIGVILGWIAESLENSPEKLLEKLHEIILEKFLRKSLIDIVQSMKTCNIFFKHTEKNRSRFFFFFFLNDAYENYRRN